jgi:glutathione S-transferase
MKLRHSPTSPFVRKVMVVALETGLIERIERIPTAVAPTKPNEEVARENPLVKVPALTTDDGLVLYDSPVICEYLDTLHSGAKLFPAAGKPRWVALRQQALGDGLLEAAILARYESVRPPEHQWPDWIDAQLRKVRGALAALEQEATSGELAGGANGDITIGQIAIGCALGYLELRYPNEGWRNRCRNLDHWFEGFSQRKSMQLTVPRA